MATRWKWILLTLSLLFGIVAIARIVNCFGAGSPPWFGWWDATFYSTGQPYVMALDTPPAGGAAATAGLRAGDTIDLREQSLESRLKLVTQPMAGVPVPVIAHRGATTLKVSIVPSNIYQVDPTVKIPGNVPPLLASLWLFGCALLIAVRRPDSLEARLLAFVLMAEGLAAGYPVPVPSAAASMVICVAQSSMWAVWAVLLVVLSARFGERTAARRVIEAITSVLAGLAILYDALFIFGLVTLRIDPLRFGQFGVASPVNAILKVSIVLAAITTVSVAVASTRSSERPRVGWLLFPMPIAAFGGILFALVLPNFAHTWTLYAVEDSLSAVCILVGAWAVTYALLKRRVLDFEFVIGRTVVVATVSLIVVAAFTLLEWLLGTVLSGVDKAASLVANAALALVLGLSLRFIHKRVDAFVETTLFRKRHDDERALLDFSKEASFMTDADALLDQAISHVREHTDARSGVLYLDGEGVYRPARSFGDKPLDSVGENDGAIVALKTWRKPLDPHRCVTSLQGALAVPMLGRGRLVGLLVVGERAGGEAYATDEVEALSQFAHGVGSALDTLSADGSGAAVGATLAKIETMLEQVLDAVTPRIRSSESPGSP